MEKKKRWTQTSVLKTLKHINSRTMKCVGTESRFSSQLKTNKLLFLNFLEFMQMPEIWRFFVKAVRSILWFCDQQMANFDLLSILGQPTTDYYIKIHKILCFCDRVCMSLMFFLSFNGRGYFVYVAIYGEPEISKRKKKRSGRKRKKYMNFGEPYTFLKPWL